MILFLRCKKQGYEGRYLEWSPVDWTERDSTN